MKTQPYASSAVTLKNLIYLREQVEIKEIMNKLQNLVFEKDVPFYDAWMKELSDEIISTSTAFAHRFFLQSTIQ